MVMHAKHHKTEISVIMVDDHPMLRAGFIASLADYDDIHVLGETGSIDEASVLFKKLKPDVVVLDVMFSGKQTGLNSIKSLLEIDPSAKVVVLSQFEQDTLVREAYRLGAMAFIVKSADVDELVQAIRKAQLGDRYYMPSIAEKLAAMAIQPMTEPLSRRELAVLALISEGSTTQDISTKLELSPRTVADVITHLKNKFQVKRRRDLIPIGQRYQASL